MNDLFKEKANDWDINEMVQKLSTAIGQSIVNSIKLSPTMQVMDFGAGTGLITSQIAPHVNKVVAVDVSQSMLEQLFKKLQAADNKNIDILCQDITQKPTGDVYDLIVSAMAMHHVKDTDNLLKQFAVHLKPGAKIAVADLDEEDGSFHPADARGVYHKGFNRQNFKRKLKESGFIDIEMLTVHSVLKNQETYPVFLCIATKK